MIDLHLRAVDQRRIQKLRRIAARRERLTGAHDERADVDVGRAAGDVDRRERFAGRREPLVFERLERERDHFAAEQILRGDRQEQDQRARVGASASRAARSCCEQLGADRRFARLVRVRLAARRRASRAAGSRCARPHRRSGRSRRADRRRSS